MVIANINERPDLVILDNDEKYLASMTSGFTTVYIGKPKKAQFHTGKVYPIYINGQEIYGTGTDSLAAAISWVEKYLMIGARKPSEDVIETLRSITRDLSVLELAIEDKKIKIRK